jgi:enhancer of polycomb-like protein
MSFRRRVGRGGRLWMDRRGPSRNSALYKSSLGGGPGPMALADAASLREQMERFEYDVDSDDDMSDEVHINDPYDNLNIRYRIIFTVPPQPRGDQHHAAMQQQRMVEDALKRGVAAGQVAARGLVPQKQAVAAK